MVRLAREKTGSPDGYGAPCRRKLCHIPNVPLPMGASGGSIWAAICAAIVCHSFGHSGRSFKTTGTEIRSPFVRANSIRRRRSAIESKSAPGPAAKRASTAAKSFSAGVGDG
jgi:hypothetical protein